MLACLLAVTATIPIAKITMADGVCCFVHCLSSSVCCLLAVRNSSVVCVVVVVVVVVVILVVVVVVLCWLLRACVIQGQW